MATYIQIAGFEHGSPPGGFVPDTAWYGIFNGAPGTAGGTPSFSSTYAHSGTYSHRVNNSGSGNSYNQWNLGAAGCGGSASSAYLVARVWCYLEALPSGDSQLFQANTTGAIALRIGVDSSGHIFSKMGPDTTSYGTEVVAADSWFSIDVKWDVSANPWTCDYKVNGVAETQDTYATTSTTITKFYLGCNGTPYAAMDAYLDDITLSQTTADYPLPNVSFGYLIPTGDGTHNNTTNYFEDAASAEIIAGTNPAWDNIDQVPPTLATFIQGETNTTTRYVEVTFGTPTGTPLAARGYTAVMGEASATACSCAVGLSDDGWSTVDWLWGNSTTPADPSQSSTYYTWGGSMTSNVTVFTSGTLKARYGWTADAAPDVLCGLILIEYIYTSGASTPQAVDVAATVTIALARSPRKPIAVGATLTADIARKVAKSIAATSTSTVEMARKTAKTLAMAATATVELGKRISKSVAVTMTATIDLVTSKLKQQAIAVSATLTVALSRMVGKPLTVGATVTMALAKQVPRIIAVGATATVELARRTAKSIAATTTATIDLVTAKLKQQAIAVGTTITVALSRSVGKPLAVGATLTVALARRTAKAIAVGATHTVALARRTGKGLAMTATATVAMARRTGKTLGVTVTLTMNMVRKLAKLIDVALTATMELTKRIAKTIAVSSVMDVVLDAVKQGAGLLFQTVAVSATFTVGIVTKTLRKLPHIFGRLGYGRDKWSPHEYRRRRG